MITFILNSKTVQFNGPSGLTLLEYVRYHQRLTGTKTGCNEGDCGACTVLVGDLVDGKLSYQSYTSCLTPLGKVHGKHVITVEGLNMSRNPGDIAPESLNPVQRAMYDESATQCGFCTPGFVVSMAGFCLGDNEATAEKAIACVDGNICRCTGYKSIERAADKVAALLAERKDLPALEFAVSQNILPEYLLQIPQRLLSLKASLNGDAYLETENPLVGGGTDLYVQKHEDMKDEKVRFLYPQAKSIAVRIDGDTCIIHGDATVSDLIVSLEFNRYFPDFREQVKLVSSTQIRNMATLAGNFVNASPIGDFTIFFLALDAKVVLKANDAERTIPLRSFYNGYKTLDKNPGEVIDRFFFTLPPDGSLFNFEKVSKRTHLDIASVNTAMLLQLEGDFIKSAAISAGGVGPVPMFLEKTSQSLEGKAVTEETIQTTIEMANAEISPISDARGSEAYKRLLLGQLIKAHFLTLVPSTEGLLV